MPEGLKQLTLITGVNGVLGQELAESLARIGKYDIVGLDVTDPPENLKQLMSDFSKTSVLQKSQIQSILRKFKVQTVFHLAGILASEAEREPEKAQLINAGGTAVMLEVANEYALVEKRDIKFMFPSSIAVYGLPSLEVKSKYGPANENAYLNPITIYGITKLYGEQLGNYYSKSYKLMNKNNITPLDFRAVRFPGIISSFYKPKIVDSTENSDVIHSVSSGEGFESFVKPETKLPFVTIPDAVKALIQLSEVKKEMLNHTVYNVSSVSLRMDEYSQIINGVFPDSSISYTKDDARQKIVDSWPEDLDNSAAIKDWGWKSDFPTKEEISKYLSI